MRLNSAWGIHLQVDRERSREYSSKMAFRFARLVTRPLVRLSQTKSWSTTSAVRLMSSAADQVQVTMDEKTGVATMKLNKKPVNSLSLEFLTDLTIQLEKLENEKSCRGLIITSANPGIFSAGLDIMEMYQPKLERLNAFWSALQQFWIQLYGSRLVTAAAINGHAPAGGCLIAMSCDYRVMSSGKYTIGLNETKLGIVAPPWFRDVFSSTVGHRQCEMALQLGTLFTPQQALDIGLVDQLTADADVLPACEDELKKWLQVPDAARQLSKTAMRKPVLERLLAQRQEDTDSFVTFATKDSIQKVLGLYLESLKKPKAKV